MLPHGDAHVVSSAPGLEPGDEGGGDWLFRMRDDPKPIPITYRGGMFEAGLGLPPEDASTIILCGFIACDLKPFNPLINALPRLLHSARRRRRRLGGAHARTGGLRIRRAARRRRALLQRVSEMVFVDGARRYLESLPEQAQGWLGALRDRQIGRAITLMHGDPAQPWTLEELGSRVGLSRSALHERFVALTGLAPMQYLTNWRMQCGARLLREGHLSVAAVALEVGVRLGGGVLARLQTRDRTCRLGPGGGGSCSRGKQPSGPLSFSRCRVQKCFDPPRLISVRPQNAMVRSSSLWMISSALVTPCSPMAPRP